MQLVCLVLPQTLLFPIQPLVVCENFKIVMAFFFCFFFFQVSLILKRYQAKFPLEKIMQSHTLCRCTCMYVTAREIKSARKSSSNYINNNSDIYDNRNKTSHKTASLTMTVMMIILRFDQSFLTQLFITGTFQHSLTSLDLRDS